jgi:hypothetical protein
VVDEAGGVIGALSARDPLWLRASVVTLGDESTRRATSRSRRVGVVAAGRGIAAGRGCERAMSPR